MLFRRLAFSRARRSASAILWRRGVAFLGFAGLVVAVGLVGDHARTDDNRLRLVLASEQESRVATPVSSTALYAKNDAWKPYLASEKVCPGGERTNGSLTARAETVTCLVNFARQKRGLRALSVAPILNGASAKKAQAILRCRNFAHNPCGGDWTSAVRSTGYSGPFGENLYLATGDFGAPRPAVDAWLNSPPHRANLFKAGWREQGLAVVTLDRFHSHRDVSLWVSVLGER